MIPPDLRVLSKITQAQERPQLTPTEWKQAQVEDPDIGPVINLMKTKTTASVQSKGR